MSLNNKYIKRSLLIIVSVVMLILIDQITKNLTLAYLKNDKPFVVIPDVILLTYVENSGAAFGMLKNLNFIFYILPPLVSIVLIFFIMKIPDKKLYYPLIAGMIMIISGALGNFIDRLKYGYVVDFIYFKPIDFPVFNVADIYVTVSCFLIVFLLLFKYKDEDLKF